MRTLVFCTAHAADPLVWEQRYRPWVDAVRAGFPFAEQLLIVDDGSPTLPAWSDCHIATGDVLGEAFTAPLRPPVLLYHFRARLGRRDVLDFPGWHRSFCFAALYAEAHGFERVLHIESDACVISDQARAYLAAVDDTWSAFWCGQYDMPESAVQVASGTGLRALAAFARQPYESLIGRTHERAMPFTAAAREFTGDRYGEWVADIPPDADFAAQIPMQREDEFYWFRGPGARPPPPRVHRIRLNFTAAGNGLAALGEGWHGAEPKHHWMAGAESTLRLPRLPGSGDAVLHLRVTPHVWGDVLTRQCLSLEINGEKLRRFTIALESLLGCHVPRRVLDSGDAVLRLVHPDAAAPCDLAPGTLDTRRLSVSLEWLALAGR